MLLVFYLLCFNLINILIRNVAKVEIMGVIDTNLIKLFV